MVFATLLFLLFAKHQFQLRWKETKLGFEVNLTIWFWPKGKNVDNWNETETIFCHCPQAAHTLLNLFFFFFKFETLGLWEIISYLYHNYKIVPKNIFLKETQYQSYKKRSFRSINRPISCWRRLNTILVLLKSSFRPINQLISCWRRLNCQLIGRLFPINHLTVPYLSDEHILLFTTLHNAVESREKKRSKHWNFKIWSD